MKHLITISILLCWSLVLSAQDRDLKKEYTEFREKARKEYADFREKANAEYVEHMRHAWAWYRGEEPFRKPLIEKPVEPVVLPDDQQDTVLQSRPLPVIEVVDVQPQHLPEPEPLSPVVPQPVEVERYHDIILYGTPCRVAAHTGNRYALGEVSDASITEYWNHLCHGGYDSMLSDCLALRNSLNLCDWAYLELLSEVSVTACPDSPAEAALLQVFLMNQSGYMARISYDKTGSIHLLLTSDCDFFERPYVVIDDVRFYAVYDHEPVNLKVCNLPYPDESPVRMLYSSDMKIERDLIPSRRFGRNTDDYVTVSTDRNMLAFYESYPDIFFNSNPYTKWLSYASVPMTSYIKDSWYPYLRDRIGSMSMHEAAGFLLDRVQHDFEYGYDDEIWKRDRPFFPEETLSYEYSDCEDRAILYSRLVRDLLGLDVILVYYPGHLAAAVAFPSDVAGEYIDYIGRRFTITDPTYIGAPVGLSMPDLDNDSVIVVEL